MILSNKTTLFHSLAAGRWLVEAQFEWVNPEIKYLENFRYTEVKLAKAARKWPVANSDGADAGAFSGIQAILHMPLQKKGPFSRLIESGGGTVLDVKPASQNLSFWKFKDNNVE